jgi:hypothetical protein
MGKSLEEFFETNEATRLLVENLESNMKALGDELSPEARDMLMRTNLIMIRQCLMDCGVE